MAEQQQALTTEHRLLAAVAHASILAQGLGVVVGILVYINQREKSRFAAFQALQAAVYQVAALLLMIGSWIIWGIFYALTFIPIIQIANTRPDAPPPPIFWIGFISMVIPLLLMLVLGLYGLWGALRTWQGRDFRYPILGPWLERSGLWNNT